MLRGMLGLCLSVAQVVYVRGLRTRVNGHRNPVPLVASLTSSNLLSVQYMGVRHCFKLAYGPTLVSVISLCACERFSHAVWLRLVHPYWHTTHRFLLSVTMRVFVKYSLTIVLHSFVPTSVSERDKGCKL